MVSNRARGSNSVGNKLNQLDSRVSRTENKPQTNIDTNSVTTAQIASNSVTADSIAVGGIDETNIARGAVGTEHLGIVSEINSDSSLTLNIGGATGHIIVKGDQYPAPPAGTTSRIHIDENNNLVLGTNSATDQVIIVSDWNSATKSGFYASAAGATNAPEATSAYSGTAVVGGGYTIENVTAASNGNEYSRVYNASTSTWGSWLLSPSLVAGAVPVSQGGTGATTATAARTNLGAAALVHQHSGNDITSGTVAYSYLDTAVRNAGNLNAGTIPNGQLPGRLQETAPEISTQDLNNILTAGWYRGYSLGNAPTADWCYIQVYRHDDGYIWQIAYHYFGANHWMRRRDGGNWQGWVWQPNNDQIDAKDTAAKNELYNAYDNGRIDWRSQNQVNSATSIRPPAYGATITMNSTSTGNTVSGVTYAYGTTTVTLPGGRFSAQPVVVCTPNSGLTSQFVNFANSYNISTTSTSIIYVRGGSGSFTGIGINMVAVQAG